jgi:hypothetical protein
MATDTRLLEMRHGVSFLECLETCLYNSEFIAQWERLNKKKIVPTSPIDRMIDEATGHDVTLIGEFADFVYENVFRIF